MVAPAPEPWPAFREAPANPHYDPSLGSDGECTGIPEGFGGADWTHCCVEHDLGGRDGALADCFQDAGVPIFLALLMVTIMAGLRPLYMAGQRRGWWR